MDEDIDDVNFLDTQEEQSNVVLHVLASQEETQASEPELGDQMKKYLTTLPALQGAGSEGSSMKKSLMEAPSDSCTDDDQAKDKVLVTDTCTDVEKGQQTGPSDYVSESDSENLEDTVVQKRLDDTVTHKQDTDENEEAAEANQRKGHKKQTDCHESDESSLQSRSNLGSYDQAEVYKTQAGHAKGSRFDPFPSSQDDMFDDKQEDAPVSTPSTHLASLQISQRPMLVPETLDDSDNEIPPSPGVYGSTPIIIPNSPTQDAAGNQSDEINLPDITLSDVQISGPDDNKSPSYVKTTGQDNKPTHPDDKCTLSDTGKAPLLGEKTSCPDTDGSSDSSDFYMAQNTLATESQMKKTAKQVSAIAREEMGSTTNSDVSEGLDVDKQGVEDQEDEMDVDRTSQGFLAALQVATLVDEDPKPGPIHLPVDKRSRQAPDPENLDKQKDEKIGSVGFDEARDDSIHLDISSDSVTVVQDKSVEIIEVDDITQPDNETKIQQAARKSKTSNVSHALSTVTSQKLLEQHTPVPDPKESNPKPSDPISKSGLKHGLSALSSQKLQQASEADQEVIVIASGSIVSQQQQQELCESEDLLLRLSPSQSNASTQGHKSNGSKSQQGSSPDGQAGEGLIFEGSTTTSLVPPVTSAPAKPVIVSASELAGGNDHAERTCHDQLTVKTGKQIEVEAIETVSDITDDKKMDRLQDRPTGEDSKGDNSDVAKDSTTASDDEEGHHELEQIETSKHGASHHDVKKKKSASQGVRTSDPEVDPGGRRSRSVPRSHADKERSRSEKSRQKINDNPLIQWQDESDIENKMAAALARSSERFTGEFHLEIPRDSNLPASEILLGTQEDEEHDKTNTATGVNKEMAEITASGVENKKFGKGEITGVGNRKLAITEGRFDFDTARVRTDPSKQANTGQAEPGPSSEIRGQASSQTTTQDLPVTATVDKLTISMIQPESEPPVSQTIFRLQQPTPVEESEMTEDVKTVLTPPSNRKKRAFILDDSDEEDTPAAQTTPQPLRQHHVEKPNVPIQTTSVAPSPEILVAHKITASQLHEDVTEETQSYEPQVPETMDVDTAAAMVTVADDKHESVVASGAGIVKLQVEDTRCAALAQGLGDDDVVSEIVSPTARERTVTESSTQTADKPIDATHTFEQIDINVVQKVAEYLQSGYSPRSRTSSTTTDLSDLHGEGSEKADGTMKTPHGKGSHVRTDNLKTPRTRRESADQRVKKSPKEIQTIIQTYSHIISKQKKKQLSKHGEEVTSPTSQRPNMSAFDKDADQAGKLVPRRLSTQSLPEELLRSKQASQGVAHVSHDIGTKSPFVSKDGPPVNVSEQWISAKKPPIHPPQAQAATASSSFAKTQKLHQTTLLKSISVPTGESSGLSQDLNKSFVPTVVPSILNLVENTDKDLTEVVEKSDKDGQMILSNIVGISSDTNKPFSLTSEKTLVLGASKPAGNENKDYLNTPVKTNTSSAGNIDVARSAKTVVLDSSRVTTSPSATTKRSLTISRAERSARHAKKRSKKFLSAQKRNERRRSMEALSPQSATSGSFLAGTQMFAVDQSTAGERDPYKFMSSQSQSVDADVQAGGSIVKTPLSSRKRLRLQHKISGLKKSKTNLGNDAVGTGGVHHVGLTTGASIAALTNPTSSSQSSETTVSTCDSIPSIPSSISQASPIRDSHNPVRDSVRDAILSPSSLHHGHGVAGASGTGRARVSDEISTRLSGKRLSIDQHLPDTLPLSHSEEDNYQQVTVVIEKVERVFREITTTKKVLGPQGQVIERTEEVQRLDPVIVEENTHKKVQYIYIPSPSRSATSMTSGDLADVSSSLSRSSISSGSLGSKVSLVSSGSSLDQPGALSSRTHGNQSTSLDPDHPGALNTKMHSNQSTSLDQDHPGALGVRTHGNQSSLDQQEALSSHKDGDQSARTVSVAANSSEQATSLPSIGNSSKMEAPLQVPRSRTPRTPSIEAAKPLSPPVSAKSATPVQHSDQENLDTSTTPLGSTINKTGSYLHSRTVSMESPKTSDSLFSSSSDEHRKHLTSATNIPLDKFSDKSESGLSRKSSDPMQEDNPTYDSDGSAHQDQAVSSSNTPNTPEHVAMVTSAGNIGSRVIAKWKDGYYYPGVLKSSVDRYGKHQVRFDDGDNMSVKVPDILLIEKLPVGQSVMVLTDAGDFECGLILQQQDLHYMVETDEGESGSYSFSQVILSSDQAACIISDRGKDVLIQGVTGAGTGLPTNVGDVSLENLVDAPRRSAKKQTTVSEVKVKEEKGQGQSTRCRKRKLGTLQPQATSTPTPKGKGESVLTKRRKVVAATGPSSSPIRGIQDSPSTSRTRKTRVGLFSKDLGPIPTKKLFRGITFVLTNVEKSVSQKAEERKLLQDSSLETSTDESAAEEDTQVAFDKDWLTAQIEAGGGTIVDNVDPKLVGSGKRKIVVLSSTYQRTIKYLQCLAFGVPCLSHMWVVDSCTQDVQLDEKSYVLPAGISLEKRKIMEWKGKKDVLQGIKAIVYSKNTKFTDTWANILTLAHCHVHQQLQYTDVHVIVTDNTSTGTVERQAENHGVALVSTEWVIQSLVNARVMSYDGHPRYRHDLLL